MSELLFSQAGQWEEATAYSLLLDHRGKRYILYNTQEAVYIQHIVMYGISIFNVIISMKLIASGVFAY